MDDVYEAHSVNLLIISGLTHFMFVRSILIGLFVIIVFTASLAISYEGFQISPNLRIQHASVTDTQLICQQMDSILQSKSISYENVIRLLNNSEINSYFTSQEIDIVEQCLQGKLPA